MWRDDIACRSLVSINLIYLRYFVSKNYAQNLHVNITVGPTISQQTYGQKVQQLGVKECSGRSEHSVKL